MKDRSDFSYLIVMERMDKIKEIMKKVNNEPIVIHANKFSGMQIYLDDMIRLILEKRKTYTLKYMEDIDNMGILELEEELKSVTGSNYQKLTGNKVIFDEEKFYQMFTSEQSQMFNFLIESFTRTFDDKEVAYNFKDVALIFAKCIFSLAILDESVLRAINNNSLNQTEIISYIKELSNEHPSKMYFLQLNNLSNVLKNSIAANIEDIFKTTQCLINKMKIN